MQGAELQQYDEPAPTAMSAWLKRIVVAIAIAILLAGLGYAVKALFSGSGPQKKAITTIKLLPDTPPPPPPPPKEPPKEQPKDQPKEIKEVPQPKPEQTPPAEVLKMEGAAGDGPSPFAAGAVSKEYTDGNVGTKIGGNGPSQASIVYANKAFNKLQEAINNEKDLSSAQYKVVVFLWVDKDGVVEKIDLRRGSGNADTDQLLKRALTALKSMGSAPPEGMPSPIKIEMTSKSSS